MGAAEKARKERRRKKLTRLAKEDPEKFEQEWEKRIESWLKHIQGSSRDKAFFTEKEYKDFLKRFPHAADILVEPLIRHRNGKVIIYTDKISFYREKYLGTEAYDEIMNHVKVGTLKGRQVFEFVKRAKEILMECGDKAVELALKETEEVLGNECCCALARSIGCKIYRMNWHYENPLEKPCREDKKSNNGKKGGGM